MEQPVRTKHCSFCQKCVASYDHHCFWIGNCIGERNRLLFMIFLIEEIIRIVLFEYTLITARKPDSQISNLV